MLNAYNFYQVVQKSTSSTSEIAEAMAAIQKRFTAFKNDRAIRSICGEDADSDGEAPKKRRKMK